MMINKRREILRMKLKENIDFIDFIKKIKTCKGDVYFCTLEGDRLNLKSVLSQYIFSANSHDKRWMDRMRNRGGFECIRNIQKDLKNLRDSIIINSYEWKHIGKEEISCLIRIKR